MCLVVLRQHLQYFYLVAIKGLPMLNFLESVCFGVILAWLAVHSIERRGKEPKDFRLL